MDARAADGDVLGWWHVSGKMIRVAADATMHLENEQEVNPLPSSQKSLSASRAIRYDADMKTTVVEFFGWCGMIVILLAYGLSSFGIISSASWIYQTLNLFGAFGIIGSSLAKKDLQPVFLNVIWAIIALFALGRLFLFS